MTAEGAAAEAIRAAETALARQQSVVAHVDLQVVTAVLNAHTAHGDGAAALESLQADIEAAVATRTGLDTPAGAREFQRYLIDKLHDIRAVVEQTDLDDTSKAALAAALASLYAAPGETSAEPANPGPVAPPADPDPVAVPAHPAVEDFGSPGIPADPGIPDESFYPAEPPAAEPPAAEPAPVTTAPPGQPAAPAAAMPSIPLPALGGGAPSLAPLGGLGGLGGLSGLNGPRDPAPEDPAPEDPAPEDPAPEDPAPEDPAPEDLDSPLPDVIAEAVSGTPIPDAFDRQGITIPDPGTPVGAPLDQSQVGAGDIGLFEDRHALALGNGRALLDDQIQPIETVNRPGFLGWQHPPEPDPESQTD